MIGECPSSVADKAHAKLISLVGGPGAPPYIGSMSTLIVILIALAMAGTAFVLVKGVVAMASGKDIGGVKQQKLMRQRVLLQAIAVLLVMLFLMLARSHG